MTRIVIADDQALFREGLRTLLSTRSDMDVVGEGPQEPADRVHQCGGSQIHNFLSLCQMRLTTSLRPLREDACRAGAFRSGAREPEPALTKAEGPPDAR
jgi:DNA-binding NarL/FixJ family response regulator